MKVAQLIKDMNAGQVGALIMTNTNPVYTLPNAIEFTEALKKVKLNVTFSMSPNETTTVSQYVIAISPPY